MRLRTQPGPSRVGKDSTGHRWHSGPRAVGRTGNPSNSGVGRIGNPSCRSDIPPKIRLVVPLVAVDLLFADRAAELQITTLSGSLVAPRLGLSDGHQHIGGRLIVPALLS